MFILFALFICTCLFSAPSPCPFAPAVCTLFGKSMRVVNTPLIEFLLVRRLSRSFMSPGPSCPHIRCTHRTDLSSATTPSRSASESDSYLSASIVHRTASRASFRSPSGEPGVAGCSKRPRSAAPRVAQVLEQRAHGLGGGRPAWCRCIARLAVRGRFSFLRFYVSAREEEAE